MNQTNWEELFSKLEKRVTAIEKHLSLTPAPASPIISTPSIQAAPVPKKIKEHKQPLNWLGIIGVICFVVAAGFIIKLSIESGWLTPERRIISSLLFGTTLIATGFYLARKDREYASLLPAGGILVYYLTALASYHLYQLIPFEGALTAITAASALCLWLYTKFKHSIYLLCAGTGAYLIPLLLARAPDIYFPYSYFMVCTATFCLFAVWAKSRALILICAYLSILMTGAITGDHALVYPLAMYALGFHFLVLCAATYAHTRYHGEPLTQKGAWMFMPILVIFYALEYHFIKSIYPEYVPWIALGFACVPALFYMAAKPHFAQGLASLPVVVSFATLVVFHSLYLELIPLEHRYWVFVAIMGVICVLPAKKDMDKAFIVPLFTGLAILAIEYLSMLSKLYSGHEATVELVTASLCAIALLWVFLLSPGKKEPFYKNSYGIIVLTLTHLLALAAFYRLTEPYGPLAISASWLYYAVVVMVLGFVKKHSGLTKSALMILVFAAGKVLLLDIVTDSTLIKILCLLLTGTVLYGSGLVMRRTATWKEPDKS